MARNYVITGTNTTAATTSFTTVCQIHGAALCQTRVFDMTVGCQSSPTDNATQWALQRYTAAGTGMTSFTPLGTEPIIGTPVPSLAVGGAAATAINSAGTGTEATVTSVAASTLWLLPLNARATFRYVASPGAEFINAFLVANGLVLRQLGAATQATVGTATAIWFE